MNREKIIMLEAMPGETRVLTHTPLKETDSKGLYERRTNIYSIPASGPVLVTSRQEMMFLAPNNEWIHVRDRQENGTLPYGAEVTIVPEEGGKEANWKLWLVSNN